MISKVGLYFQKNQTNLKLNTNSLANKLYNKGVVTQDSVSFSAQKSFCLDTLIKDTELKIKDKSEECAIILSPKTGKTVEADLNGTAGEINISSEAIKGNIILHNHPCKIANIVLGENDITCAIMHRAKEIRAITPKNTWSSIELPDKLSKKDSNDLLDICLDHLFSNEEYLVLRKQIKQDKKGNYLNTPEELTYISNFTSDLLGSMALKMQKQGFNVKYKTGKYQD